jgi:carboxyl-terminal processing protease
MAGLLLGAALALPLVLTTVGCRTAPPGESAVAAITRELTFTNETGVVVSGRDVAYEDMALLVEAILLVKQSYVEERPFRELLYGAIDGMLVSLDPHSAFLKPESYDALQEETQGSFCGIGITIGVQNGMLTVIAPIEDSPAFRQGLHSGDRIAAVEGVTTRGMTVDQAVGRLRGARGTAVTLTIHREGAEPRDVTIVRDEIRLTSVKGARVLENGIGYVRIIQFGEKTPAEFTEALRGLRAQQIRGLVIDLRGNPGGLLESAVAVAQHFLPERATVVSIRGRAGAADERVFRAGGPDHDAALPLAVLINRGSASASEIVAGALQDHARAVIVGETSFGKASVQNVIATRTRPSCAVKLTTAHYFTPLGRLIHGKGIVPGEVVPLKQEQWRQVQLKRLYEEMPDAYPAAAREPVDQAIDTQLERALARLRPAPAGDAPKAGSSRESKETSLTNAAPAE